MIHVQAIAVWAKLDYVAVSFQSKEKDLRKTLLLDLHKAPITELIRHHKGRWKSVG